MDGNSGAGRISIDGNLLEFRLIGPLPAQSPTIVLLHEGLGSIGTWGDFPRRLSEATGAGVFAYSRAGYGASPPVDRQLPVDYIRRHATDALPKILEKIEFRRGLLLGHSDGASMAAAYAGTIDDPRLCGLILVAPHFSVEPETLAEIRKAREAYERRDLRRRLARYHENVDAAFWGWNDVWLDPEFAAFHLRAELARIRVPTLVIRGDDDRYGTHRQVWIAKESCRCPLEILLMPDCGHVPHREKPDQTVDVIADFVRRVLPSGETAAHVGPVGSARI
jgi:pimeloyl-ACP methyl ester carboxylesterase